MKSFGIFAFISVAKECVCVDETPCIKFLILFISAFSEGVNLIFQMKYVIAMSTVDVHLNPNSNYLR